MIDAKIMAVAPWFGSKRTLAPEIVHQLGRHSFYFEGCAGSLSVILAKEPSEHETVCDLHGALTNLAWVVQDEVKARVLFNRLQTVLYSDELYNRSKEWLAEFERTSWTAPDNTEPHTSWAYHYFIASWMGRNGIAGTARINYQIATRWTKGGGSGPLRFRNAVDSIPDWCDRLRNVHILRRDLFDVLTKIEDAEGVAIYCDPPYLPDTVASNSKYLCGFDDVVDFMPSDGGPIRRISKHELLALQLAQFKKARVVVSYYASPLLANLYPGWTVLDCSRHKHLHTQNKRGSKRREAPEVLLINGPAFESRKMTLAPAELLFAEA